MQAFRMGLSASALCLGTLLGSLLLPHSLAQQAPPLQGQGVDPVFAGVSNSLTDVYMTIELSKLLHVNEEEYTFDALLKVQQTWTDPRAFNTWAIIQAKDPMNNVTGGKVGPSQLSQNVDNCVGSHNISSSPCTALPSAPPCAKYCTTHGVATDNPFRCCDLVWLPNMQLQNLVDTSQDRVVSDIIFGFDNPFNNENSNNNMGVHRETTVLGRFYAPMHFRNYPFDKQTLQILISPDLNPLANSLGVLNYDIVPSATFWRRNGIFKPTTNAGTGAGGNATRGETGQVQTVSEDELGKWNIDDVSFNCSLVYTANVFAMTQGYDPNDLYSIHLQNISRNTSLRADPNNQLLQTCALTIVVSRLSFPALVVQTVIPVSFIGALSFVIFFASPENIDFRITTEVSAFLALTAMQFVFVGMLPVASYLTILDIFILLTYCNIILLVIESLIVYYISTRDQHVTRAGSYVVSPIQGEKQQLRHEGRPAQMQMNGHQQQQQERQLEGVDEEKGADGFSVLLEEGTGGKMQLSEDEKNSNGAFNSVRLGSIRTTLARGHKVLAQDPAFAYRLACKIDRIAGIVLCLLYAFMSVLFLSYKTPQ